MSMTKHKVVKPDDPPHLAFIKRWRAEGKVFDRKPISQMHRERGKHDAFCAMVMCNARKNKKSLYLFLKQWWKYTSKNQFPKGANSYAVINTIRRKLAKGGWLTFLPIDSRKSQFKQFILTVEAVYGKE